MTRQQTRAEHAATLAHMDALNRDAEYAKAEAARDWDRQNRYEMLAAELGLFNHVFDIPEYGACLRDSVS